ncbi:MAG: extracellular solute-binding protein family 5 [Firmicutes bacterium]|nr:extracellular solute-binding protein family 5 [Bacillota bacterium]
MNHRSIMAAVLLPLSLLLAAGCAPKSSSTPPPAQSGPQVGVYVNSSDVVIFWDPSDSFSNEIIAMHNLYETLLRYNPATDKFEPILAESYAHSTDAKTWTFTLRKGVKFHGSNKEMTAEDVKKSIERTMTRGKGAAFIWDAVDKIEVKDPTTVVFHLKYAAPLDLIAASSYGAFVYDVDYAESKGGETWFGQGNDAGTGPYTVESWKKGEDLVLNKFDGYRKGWAGKHFDKVVFKAVTEPATRQQVVNAGEADFVNMMPYDMLKGYENQPELAVRNAKSFENLFALINTKKITNPKVREALALAFPYDAAVNSVAQGYATQSRGIVPDGMWGHAASVPQRKTDTARAIALMAEAGAKDLKVTITYSSGDDAQRQIVELWVAELKKIGVTAEPKGMTWEAQLDLGKAKDPGQRQDIFLMYWWPDVTTPHSWHQSMFHSEKDVSFNLGYYSNPAYDAIIDDAVKLAGTDRAKAAARYAEADQLLYNDAVAIPIYDIQYARVVKKSLKGYVDNPSYPHVVFWYDVYRE